MNFKDYDDINQYNFDMCGSNNIDDIRESLSKLLEPKLKEYLNEKPSQSLKEKLEESIVKCLDENMEKGQQHIKIEVTATPEQIENYQYTITFTALDEYGVELIKDMGDRK